MTEVTISVSDKVAKHLEVIANRENGNVDHALRSAFWREEFRGGKQVCPCCHREVTDETEMYGLPGICGRCAGVRPSERKGK